jgi:hypothetical protein
MDLHGRCVRKNVIMWFNFFFLLFYYVLVLNMSFIRAPLRAQAADIALVEKGGS